MPPTFGFTRHALDMLTERIINEEWVWRAIEQPDSLETGEDGNTHYLKGIVEREGRFLRVVVNPNPDPLRIITVFFDRRLGKRS